LEKGLAAGFLSSSKYLPPSEREDARTERPARLIASPRPPQGPDAGPSSEASPHSAGRRGREPLEAAASWSRIVTATPEPTSPQYRVRCSFIMRADPFYYVRARRAWPPSPHFRSAADHGAASPSTWANFLGIRLDELRVSLPNDLIAFGRLLAARALPYDRTSTRDLSVLATTSPPSPSPSSSTPPFVTARTPSLLMQLRWSNLSLPHRTELTGSAFNNARP
jgi:hypothetical protein